MKLVEFLSPNRVMADLSSTTKTDLLVELTHVLVRGDADFPAQAEEQVLEALMERERIQSTGIADGVAIPHGKHPALKTLKAALGVHRQGVDFAAMDGQPSRIFLVLVAPENSAGLHLKALARISRLFKEASLRDRVLAAPDAAAMYKVIAEEDSRL